MTPSIGQDQLNVSKQRIGKTNLARPDIRHSCSYDGSAAQLRQDVSHDREATFVTLIELL